MEGCFMTARTDNNSNDASNSLLSATKQIGPSNKRNEPVPVTHQLTDEELANAELPNAELFNEELLDVAIDVSAIKANSGGVRRYAHELVGHLRAQQIRPLLLARSNDLIDAWPGADRFIASAPANRVRRLLWEQRSLLKALHGAAPDISILHSPHYTMPRMSNGSERAKPNGSTMKRVVTIHDLSYFTRPEDHSFDKRTLFQAAIARAAKSADALICVSDRTAQALHEFVNVSAPVFVAPHGIDHARFQPLHENDQQRVPLRADDQRARESLGVNGDYIVSISAIEPRKNLPMLIRAYEELLANDPALRHITLVIGGEGWPGEVEQLPTSRFGRILKTGFVPEACVAPLFRGALCVAYPSFEEGFGLPAIEALACGAPVVTTAGSVMHDLMGSAAIAVDVNQAETLATGLALALSGGGPPLADRLAIAHTFTWTKSAKCHADAYRSCR
jgi:glycosyltransferase involved in cell wall biosynthesis